MVYCYYSRYMNHHQILIWQYHDPRDLDQLFAYTHEIIPSFSYRQSDPQKKCNGLVGDLHMFGTNGALWTGGWDSLCPELSESATGPRNKPECSLWKAQKGPVQNVITFFDPHHDMYSVVLIFTWHMFWHLMWHSIWHSIWRILTSYSIWHSTEHLFWHKIWHSIWDAVVCMCLCVRVCAGSSVEI